MSSTLLLALSVLALPSTASTPPESESVGLDFEMARWSAARAASAAPAPASDVEWDFGYTFVELGASFLDPDFAGVDADDVDTYYGKASLGLFDFLYVFGAYENQDFEFNNTDSTNHLFRLGAGGHVTIMDGLDVQGDVAWLYSRLDSDLSQLDDDHHGYEIRAGGRWMPIEFPSGGIELNGGVTWRNLDDQIAADDHLVGWDAGARVHFLELLSVGASFQMMEGDQAFLVNARVTF